MVRSLAKQGKSLLVTVHRRLVRTLKPNVNVPITNCNSLSAAHLGLPKLIREEDVHCEYPVDADDEYVTEKGFLPTLPGESTKLSSALALFRLCRILSRTLAELYPTSSTHDLSFRTVASLADELDEWQNNLAPHLRLTFAQDKPSTNVTSSRAPILVCLIFKHPSPWHF